jgi:hypothetical protein
MLAGRAKPVTARRVLHGIVQTVLALTVDFTASRGVTCQYMRKGSVMRNLHTLTKVVQKVGLMATQDVG